MSGVKPHLKCLHWSLHIRRILYGRLWHHFLALALSDELMSNLLPVFVLPLLGLRSGVKPHLTLLALVIPYPGNHKVRYDIVFSYGTLYINKKKKLLPLFFADFKGWFWGESPTPNLPAIHFRDTYGTSNQPMGSNILALLTWITVLGSRSNGRARFWAKINRVWYNFSKL